jgi:hypothetical protein
MLDDFLYFQPVSIAPIRRKGAEYRMRLTAGSHGPLISKELLSGYRFDPLDLRYQLSYACLDALFEGHLRHRASAACSEQANSNYSVLNVNQFNVPAIGLQGRAD